MRNVLLDFKGSLNKAMVASLGIATVLLWSLSSFAQGTAIATAKMDATQIAVGDQARLFIEVQSDPAAGRLQWAVVPDTFNNLEITDRSKIDTIKQGSRVIYKQRLTLTGFDSGVFKIPAVVFSVIPNSGTPYTVQTDSFSLLVQTVAVDTTKAFRGIKNIIYVKSTWLDYIWYIVGALVFVVLIVVVLLYFLKNRKEKPAPKKAVLSLQDKTLQLLNQLEARQLWQKRQVKEYYIELTDIVRNYIEARFNTPALELTTDEILYKAQFHREMQPYHALLAEVLHTADLAKFAKFQPLPQEHSDAMDKARKFVDTTRPKEVAPETNPAPTANTTTITPPSTGNTNPRQ